MIDHRMDKVSMNQASGIILSLASIYMLQSHPPRRQKLYMDPYSNGPYLQEISQQWLLKKVFIPIIFTPISP